MRIVALIVLLALVAGCKSLRPGVSSVPPYQPHNVYCPAGHFPEPFHRVLLLPLANQTPATADSATSEQLQPVLAAELRKCKVFEVATCTLRDLKAWTGRETWSAADELPVDLLEKLKAHTGCDGILFSELTHYHGYPPLAVGFILRLVECRTGKTVWSIDETLDASSAPVAAGAQAYGRAELRQAGETDWLMQNSPRHFGQYSAWLLLSTLPTQTVKGT